MKRHFKYLSIVVVIAIIIMIPLLHGVYYSGHDTPIHVANIYALTSRISFSNPFVSLISPMIGNNFGYGTGLFYPPMAYMVGTYFNFIFNNFGISVIGTMKFINLFITVLSGISMYFCACKFLNNKKIAVISSLIYITFPYFLSEVYIRDAMAERYLFIFIPMIFSGIYSLFENDLKKFYLLFTVGYVGGILSHFTLMIYFTVLFAIFLLIYSKKVFKLEFLKHFFISAFIVTLIVSPFLETMISHKILGDYVVFQEGAMADKISDKGLTLLLGGGDKDIYHSMLLTTLILFIITLINCKKIKFPKLSVGLIVFGILSYIMALKYFPWDYLPISFRMIQFPWRFEVFMIFSISLISPLCLQLINKKEKIIYGMVVILLIIGGYRNIGHSSNNFIKPGDIWYEAGMGWQKEYLPVKTKSDLKYYYSRGGNIIYDKNSAKIIVSIDRAPDLEFEVRDLEEEIEIELPRLYYLGYQLKLDDQTIDLYESDYGFLAAMISENGTYTLEFTSTLLYRILLVFSISTVFVSLGVYFYVFRKNI